MSLLTEVILRFLVCLLLAVDVNAFLFLAGFFFAACFEPRFLLPVLFISLLTAFLFATFAASKVRAFATSLTFLPAKTSPQGLHHSSKQSNISKSFCSTFNHGHDSSSKVKKQTTQSIAHLTMTNLPWTTSEHSHTMTLLIKIITYIWITHPYVKELCFLKCSVITTFPRSNGTGLPVLFLKRTPMASKHFVRIGTY